MSKTLSYQPVSEAISDALAQMPHHDLLLHTSYGATEQMPVEVFFRSYEEMPLLEQYALEMCQGKILDIGAGAGAHCLVLQEMNQQVSALEISPLLTKVMQKRGVKNTFTADIFTFTQLPFDTLLLLMNGIGLAGQLSKLQQLLQHLKSLLSPQGQILLDSSDIRYLYGDTDMPENSYFGEIAYQYEYRGKKGDWFSWLYVDIDTLSSIASQCGYHCQLIHENEEEQYLARLTLLETE
ncbi:methyltransferase domain-containing protein [Rapidithrix thailandica]|uniref:Methyltransferase domain-containing protein n=1 Tax=Rapidithrix thailandica TaxID=413964 RepID=A0AAW9S1L2_9BACT